MYASICRLRLALSRHLRKWTYALVGREISRITRYADRVVHVDPLPSDTGMLLESIDAPLKQTSASENLADVAPGQPGRISFRADLVGRFDLELEDRAVLIAELRVS